MKLKGISDQGLSRIARTIHAQGTEGEPDYGDSPNPEEVKQELERAGAEWTSEGWIIPGDLVLNLLDLTRLPLIKEVGGNFDCWDNNLVSLAGCPKSVGGNFLCDNNQLTSLEGAPQLIKGNFHCSYNALDSLEGSPQEIIGNFLCDNNQLNNLEGAPQVVNGNFDCSGNPGSEGIWGFTKKDVKAVCDVGGKIKV